MARKRFIIMLLPFLCLIIMPLVAHAATITTCTFDRSTYNQGETGYLTVTVHNDEDAKIQVTELLATINYYYTDSTAYSQTFYTDDALPVEIQPDQTNSFNLPFSLPTNVAPGYTAFNVKAKTEVWNNHSETWFGSEHPTFNPVIYVESPFKELFEDQQTTNSLLEAQVQDLQSINTTTTNIMYLLGITAAVFAAITVVMFLSRRTRAGPQPAV
ncbi:MAG: hypothetical protein NWE81_01935 [Candidatus Bathyarchaeota archaeon]|nr:hypothetical protein [Candidatus Bathyarchaeota archaeon]